MERKPTVRLVYEDFVPSHWWAQEEGFETLIVELPEFKNEQIWARLEETGKLRVGGERPLGGNRWSRFRLDIPVPEYCRSLETRFENGRYHVKILPKSSKRMQVLVNVIVAVALLVVMAMYLTSKD